MRGSVFKRGRTWTYVLSLGREPGTAKKRQRRVGGFKTKRDAELALTRALAAQEGGGATVAATGLTVAQFIDEWLEAVRPSLKATTTKSYVETAHGYVTPRIAHLRLDSLSDIGRLRALLQEHSELATAALGNADHGETKGVTRTLLHVVTDWPAGPAASASMSRGTGPAARQSEDRSNRERTPNRRRVASLTTGGRVSAARVCGRG